MRSCLNDLPKLAPNIGASPVKVGYFAADEESRNNSPLNFSIMNFKQEFGQTCKAARLALNLTTSELSARVGMSRQQIVNIESGRSFPGDVDCLLKALNIECKFTPPGRVTHINVTAKEWFDKTYGTLIFRLR